MAENNKHQSNNILFHEVDRTIYEIMVKQSDNASESMEDILVRLIAEDPVFRKGGICKCLRRKAISPHCTQLTLDE